MVPAIPETRYTTTGDGPQIAYQVLGDGPLDLVYLNGLTQHIDVQWDHPVMQRFLERLASFSRLILFDRRDAFASDSVSLEALPTAEDWAQSLRTVLDAVGSNQAAIFAELDACQVPMVFAATQPNRTTALIVANPTARFMAAVDYPIGVAPEVIEAMMAWYETSWGTEDLARVAFPSMADDPSFLRWRTKWMRASASPRMAAAVYRYLLSSTDVRTVLPAVQAPTLVLHRSGNPYVPLEQSRYVAEHIVGARLVEIPGEDLWFFTDRSDEVLDEVEEFLTGARHARQIDRVLATVMFTDIIASTERAATLGDRRWRDLLDAHDSAVRAQLTRFRGAEIKTTGDGFIASFDGPARGIRCAQAITEAVRPLGIEIRAGLHTGECEVRGSDLGGLAVHIAARVGSLARPGEVLVSSTVKDLVAGSGIQFADRGAHVLKGVPEEWRLYLVEAP